MVEPQSSRFWQVALRSTLLDEAALKVGWDAIPSEKRTVDAIDRRLARQLVNAGKLTLWQAQQLLAGRWQGLRIDRYELQDIIGQGGMGRVYLARDVRLNRKVALKILSRERMNNPRALTRFRREAKVGAQLQHENLVRIYDEGEAHSVRYLVMEYIEGKTVGKLIAEIGGLPAATSASIGRQVALGLEHLHQKGLLHRDVNPMNVLIDRDGTAKLTDLGLAIDLGDMDDIVTRDGATVGTFDYISPEQARHSRSVGPGADLYSLGCMLYHMIAGQVPFPMPSLPEKLYAHQLTEPDPLTEVAPGTPEGLAAIVSKLMRKTVEERYPKASDVAKALEPFASGLLSPQEISGDSPPRAGAAGAQSGVTPQGSDPDLDLKPDGTGNVAGASILLTPQPTGFMPKLDFGPELSLSEGRGGRSSKPKPKPKPKTESQPKVAKDRKPFPTRNLLIAAIGLIAVSVIGGLAYRYAKWSAKPSKLSAVDLSKNATAPVNPNDTTAEVAIRYQDGSEVAQEDLRTAIMRLAGSGGEIVLRDKKSIKAGDLKESLKLAAGHLVIRAAEGTRPEIAVLLPEKLPWIEIAPRAKLTLIGVSVKVSVVTPADAKPPTTPVTPTLIDCSGNVSFEHCKFSLSGDDRSARVVSSQGLDTRASHCFFEGFDRPIVLSMLPGAAAKVANCLFVRDVVNPVAGWAVTANLQNPPKGKERTLSMDRCTFLGAGLLATEGFSADGPLKVIVSNLAIRTSAVILTTTDAAMLSKAIDWKGKDNSYALNGIAWIVIPPKGLDGMKGGPSDLKSWTDLFKGDVGGRDIAMKFVGGSTITEGQSIEDYAVVQEAGQPPTGADTAKVGPGGKP